MALGHQELVDIAVDGYFGSVARRDTDRIAEILAPECIMRVVSAGIVYDGKPAILEHFEDFLGSYDRIEFEGFNPTADERAQKVAVRFTIILHDGAESLTMTNCNFFTLDQQGRFTEIAIYMSDLPDKGF